MGNIKDLISKAKALKKEMFEQGKAAVLQEFKEFFEKNPRVEAIRWSQYTPYFIDGDTCTFSVNEFRYLLAKDPNATKKDGEEESDDDYDDDFREEWSLRADPILPALQEFATNLSGEAVDDIFLMAFGDHSEITATAEGFKVEDYDHD